jgi:hypothetical protein
MMKKTQLKKRFHGKRKKMSSLIKEADMARIKTERREGASLEMIALLEDNKAMTEFEGNFFIATVKSMAM